MRFYHRFVDETLDDNGTLQQFSLHYPDNFNFGYDVVDAIADEAPQRRALVWCNQRGDERIFTFSEIKELSNRAANFFRAQGVKQGDRVMVMLKRHHEYWYTIVGLHKLGAVVIPATHMLTTKDMEYRGGDRRGRHRRGSRPLQVRLASEQDHRPRQSSRLCGLCTGHCRGLPGA